YTRIEPHRAIAYRFGERDALVEFSEGADGVTVRVSFDPEDQHPIEQQRAGWQAILDRFARHVTGG
ncbi:SRPBCC domain-containing protein, partial [Acinetobacter baumannii]